MDIFLQSIGLCSACFIGVRFGRPLFPYIFKKNLSLLKKRYNPKGDSFALITGSSDGVGKEFAKVLAQQNINIILHGRNIQKLKSVRDEILEDGKTPKGIQVEIFLQDLQEQGIKVESQASEQLEKYKIQLLINNGGITCVSSVKNTSVSEVEQIVNVNAVSPLILSRYMLQNKFMNEEEEYAIVNISSLTSKYAIGYLSTYTATKAFLHTLSQSMQYEQSTPNILLTSITPYYISTKMTRFQKLSFHTISPSEFVNASLNALLHKQTYSCGSWKHEIIHLYYSIIPKHILSSFLTKNMKVVANQLERIKLIQTQREKTRQQKLATQSSQENLNKE